MKNVSAKPAPSSRLCADFVRPVRGTEFAYMHLVAKPTGYFAIGSLTSRSLPVDDWSAEDWFAVGSIIGIICTIALYVLGQP